MSPYLLILIPTCSVLGLLLTAHRVARGLGVAVHPDRRRDLTLAGCDKREDIAAWLSPLLWETRGPMLFFVGLAGMTVTTAGFAILENRQGTAGAAVVAAFAAAAHYAFSLPAANATLLVFASRACHDNRELSPWAFLAAGLFGAFSSLIGVFGVLITVGLAIFVADLPGGEVGGNLPDFVEDGLLAVFPCIAGGIQILTLVPFPIRAYQGFIRAYPWAE